MKTLSTTAVLIGPDGNRLAEGVRVFRCLETKDRAETIVIGQSEHLAEDLTITPSRIIHPSGWEVIL